MNFLAHLHLANASPLSFVGNLMPDLTRGKLPPNLHPIINQGITRHRIIDNFTDTHHLFINSKQHLINSPAASEYPLLAGVLIDILYDHFLAKDWPSFSYYHNYPHPPHTLHNLDHFISYAYASLAKGYPYMPPRMQKLTARIQHHNWLAHYATIPGLTHTLSRMSARLTQRFNKPIDLTAAIPIFQQNYQAIRDDFYNFYPQLITHTFSQQPSITPLQLQPT